MLHEALLYAKQEDNSVICNLCAHRCHIKDGAQGICRVRENNDGELFTLVYGNLISKGVDPIEKKPLYHFYPGTKAYSIATPGCNFRCEWCQNWQISQMPRLMEMPKGKRMMPDEIVEEALQTGCKSIAYTYTEPTIFFEYSYDVAKLAKMSGLKNIYVTNGFMTPEMLNMIAPYLDAANVDIKAFRDEPYRKLMGGRLQPVLDSCQLMKELGIWLEVTTLVVPGMNDDPDELRALAGFIYESLGPETPWHLSRFYPQYRMADLRPTDESTLQKTKKMGESIGLNYVYVGNVWGGNTTRCKNCGEILIRRNVYSIHIVGLDGEGYCKTCHSLLDGVGLTSL
jgi:pyruvate formate lyase activating enzyme